MRPIVSNLAALTIVAALGACTGAEVLRVDSSPRPATEGTVPILLDEPTAGYHSIALIEVKGPTLKLMAKRLTLEAAKLGGDAVLLTRRTAASTSALIPIGSTFVSVEGEDSRLLGKVIVYTQ